MISHRSGAHDIHQILAAGDLRITDFGDDVVHLQTGFLRRAVLCDGFHRRPLRQSVALCLFADIVYGNANIRLGNVTVFYDALHNPPDMVDGNGESDVVNGGLRTRAASGVFGIGNADDLSIEVEQGAAGISGVDGAIGLNQIHGHPIRQGNFPIQGAHCTGCQRKGKLSQGVSNGYDAVSDIQMIRVAQNHRRQAFGFYFQHSDVIALIITHQRCIIGRPIIHGNRNRAGVFNYVVIRQDIAVVRENKSGAGGGGRRLEPPIVCSNLRGNAHRGIYIGRVNLGLRHLLTGVHGSSLDHRALPLPF